MPTNPRATPSRRSSAFARNAALKEQLDSSGLAMRDQLTGLFSRHYLTDYLEEKIQEASREANTVLALCDIDDFKAINDVRGHQSGDIAIVCIADILDDLAGSQPVIRWGGEELLVVLFSSPDHEALRLCDRMREEVGSYRIDDGEGEFTCTLTFGLKLLRSQPHLRRELRAGRPRPVPRQGNREEPLRVRAARLGRIAEGGRDGAR
ncbi:MAG: GGDEF domain-containing protein [Gordonibacter pamelaeae]